MNRIPKKKDYESNVVEGKIFAILAYLSVLCIIPLIIKKENPFALFHGKQGLVLFVGEVAVFLLHIIFGLWILKLGIFVLGFFSFLGIIASIKGEYLKLPLVSEVAEKITL